MHYFHSIHFMSMFLLARANTGCWALVKYTESIQTHVFSLHLSREYNIREHSTYKETRNYKSGLLDRALVSKYCGWSSGHYLVFWLQVQIFGKNKKQQYITWSRSSWMTQSRLKLFSANIYTLLIFLQKIFIKCFKCRLKKPIRNFAIYL